MVKFHGRDSTKLPAMGNFRWIEKTFDARFVDVRVRLRAIPGRRQTSKIHISSEFV
jgi:hypothetical protein